MDAPSGEFALAGSLAELRAKGRLVVHGGHRPILAVYNHGCAFALDNRCLHMGFPLDRGSVDDGHLELSLAPRPDLISKAAVPSTRGPTMRRSRGRVVKRRSLGEDDVWSCRSREALVCGLRPGARRQPCRRKAVLGLLAASVPQADIVRQVALFGAQNRDSWGVGLTILTSLANLLPMLSEEEAYLALFFGPAAHTRLNRASARSFFAATSSPGPRCLPF
jgi:hypothetical protein